MQKKNRPVQSTGRFSLSLPKGRVVRLAAERRGVVAGRAKCATDKRATGDIGAEHVSGKHAEDFELDSHEKSPDVVAPDCLTTDISTLLSQGREYLTAAIGDATPGIPVKSAENRRKLAGVGRTPRKPPKGDLIRVRSGHPIGEG